MKSTVNRETLDYADSLTGKKAVIRYEPFSVNVTNAASYDQLFVYLVTDSLPCFMKVSGTNGHYSEKLNELMSYSLVVVAQKGTQWSWTRRDKIQPAEITVQLEPVAESQLRSNLDNAFGKNIGHDFRDELDAIIENRQYNIIQQERKKQQEIDAALLPIIFPQGHELPSPAPGAQPVFRSQK